MWEYEVNTRTLRKDGAIVSSKGYAGAVGFKDSTGNECVKYKGPLPRGTYIIGSPSTNPKTGKYSLPLTPSLSNNMCGRHAFLIHGDSIKKPGTASEGCIVLPISIRMKIWASRDRNLIVR